MAEGGAPAEADQHATLAQAGIQLTLKQRMEDVEMKIAKELAALNARITDLRRQLEDAECRRAEEMEISSDTLRKNLAETLDMKERILQQKVRRVIEVEQRKLDTTCEEMRLNYRRSTKLISDNQSSIHDLDRRATDLRAYQGQLKKMITDDQETLKDVTLVMADLKRHLQHEIHDTKNILQQDIDRHLQILSDRMQIMNERINCLEQDLLLTSATSRAVRDELLSENAETRRLVQTTSEEHQQQILHLKAMMENLSTQVATVLAEQEGQKQRFKRWLEEVKYDIRSNSQTLENYRKSFDRLNNAVNASSQPLPVMAPQSGSAYTKNKKQERKVVIGNPTDVKHTLHVEEKHLQELNFQLTKTLQFDKGEESDSDNNPRKRDRSASRRQKRQS